MGDVTNILMAKRNNAACASQQEVDQRFGSCVHRYAWDLEFARDAPGDLQVGALLCELIERSGLGNSYLARNVNHLFLYSEKEADDLLQRIVQFHVKDLLAYLVELHEKGIFDLPSPPPQ